MKLQARFVFLVVIILGLVAGVLSVQHKFDLDRTHTLLASELKQRKQYYKDLKELEGAQLKTFSEDYSFWDDMVNFTKTGDPGFASENLDVGLDTFDVNAYWVYRTNGAILYQNFDGTNTIISKNDLKLPKTFFAQLDQDKFIHFYRNFHGGVMEIRAATIVPGNDPDHKHAAYGYWLVGRFFDKDYLAKMSKLTQSQISLDPDTSNPSDFIHGDTVAFANSLNDWDGKPVSLLRSSSIVPSVDDLNSSYSKQFRLLIVVSIMLVAVSFIAIWWFILRPLKTITHAIQRQDPSTLAELENNNTELGELAKIVKEFFSQKVIIAEAEFKRSELEKLNKEKATFLAVAAHELNGPISIVRLISEYVKFLVQRKASQADIDSQLERFAHQVNKMSFLINDLREASQGRSNLKLNLRPFDFDKFLNEEVDSASYNAKHKLVLTGSTNKTINSDPDRLGQVVTNLIRNAAKYSQEAPEIHIKSRVENNNIVVSVKDFGVGIAAEDQKHLFERFFRSERVSTAVPGLGLGLSICKQIIDQLGGKIWYETELGKGSTFFFSLPATEVQPPAAAKPAIEVTKAEAQKPAEPTLTKPE